MPHTTAVQRAPVSLSRTLKRNPVSLVIATLLFTAALGCFDHADAAQSTLTWSDNASNETGFQIERKTGTTGSFAQIAATGANVTSFVDQSLAAATTYCYRVRAYGTAGPSAYTNEACVTTPSTTVTSPTSRTYSLSWQDNSTTETGFKIERRTGPTGAFGQIAVTGANVTAYADANLSASTTYCYRVRAYNAAGDSPYTAEVCTTTTETATMTSALSANQTMTGSGSLTGSGSTTTTAQAATTTLSAALTRIVTGTGPGAEPRVRGFSDTGLPTGTSFLAYAEQFRGGVFVAMGDVRDTGTPDIITGPGPGNWPRVKVFPPDGTAAWSSFLAYPISFTGGVRIASCDMDGDGRAEIVTAPGPSPQSSPVDPDLTVKVWTLQTGTATLLARLDSPQDPAGGWHIACGDTNGDGQNDVVVGSDQGSEPEVAVYTRTGSRLSEISRFSAYDAGSAEGVRVAVIDVDGDGRSEVVTAPGPGSEPTVRVFSVANGVAREIVSFQAYVPAFTGGVFVAAREDATGPQIVTAPDDGDKSAAKIFAVSGTDVVHLTSFFPRGTSAGPGITVGARP